LKKDNILGSEKGEVVGCGDCYEQRRDVDKGLYCL
jgi:hypothetical protein